jgi:hypothetical protein
MGIIKEPIDIDFFVDPRPLTTDEELLIREYIKREKQLRKVTVKKVRKQNTLAK